MFSVIEIPLCGLGPEKSALNLPCACVVGCKGERPGPEEVVQVLEMLSRCVCRFQRILALIDPPVDPKPVELAGMGHELPGADRAGPRYGIGIETAFDHGNIDQVFGQALLPEDLLHHGDVPG